MEVYRGYYLFRKGGGEVIMIHDVLWQASILVTPSLKRYDIIVLHNDSLEEQVKSLIHEFVHIGIEEDYLINCPLMLRGMAEEDFNSYIGIIEKKIENAAIEVYNCQPFFVGHLRELILRSRQKY